MQGCGHGRLEVPKVVFIKHVNRSKLLLLFGSDLKKIPSMYKKSCTSIKTSNTVPTY